VSIAERRARIADLERVRGSRVVSYVLSDRETFPPGVPGFNPPMQEIHPWVIELIRDWERVDRLDLVLHTRGGAIESVWPLVSALRARCKTLGVIVPFRAHSAGTLVCLGAREIVMDDFSELSPIDPTTGNPFNPRDPGNPQAQLGISVEDVAAYFDLARDLAGLRYEDHKVEVFKQLTAQIHPLALGNIQRVSLLIRKLGRELLAGNSSLTKEDVEGAVDALTTRFYTHLHFISRREARDLLGNMVVEPKPELASAIRALFDAYKSDLKLRERYELPAAIANEPSLSLRVLGGILETTERCYVNLTDLHVSQRPKFPPGVQVQVPVGQMVPLDQWPGRLYDYGLDRTGWVRADDDVEETYA
jgi:hypothetical protein